MDDPKDRLLKPEIVALRLDISPKTLRDWLRRGKIPGRKIGGQWRIREADLDAFIDRNKNQP